MPTAIVVGLQWGDEGKGKIVDFLSREAQLVIRHQGGNNAGHTVFVGKERYILHLIPSGILYPDKLCLIGNGVVISPEILLGEMQELREKGVAITPENLMVSPNSHVILPYHVAMDKAMDAKRGIGTTGRGIGPVYSDKISRTGITVGDLVHDKSIREKIIERTLEKNLLLKHVLEADELDPQDVVEETIKHIPALKPFVGEVNANLLRALSGGKKILFEGAQGTMLDIDWGTYPYVTSSPTLSGGALLGAGLPSTSVDEVVGVVKAYTTRVGSGPFPTEMTDEDADETRNAGPVGEYGATTGRPRRCGWLDLPQLRRAVRVNGCTSLALTRLDVLTGKQKLPVCVAYDYENAKWDMPPEWRGAWSRVKPIYEDRNGWEEDISEVRVFEDLPQAVQNYVQSMEDALEVPIGLISVGPARRQTIVRRQSCFR